ncbi:Multiple RNA-binding domain-containing protein 1 [Fusarium irregulare]|uniref:Multiple RNA-binding domain-containing protein 1 n=1 Tax=Fusarium irregulare TaxID=2494466 RepID=A0A9W8PGH0_9HYPO|nr:Multiple RNA-binding domain-containing protein 1 [Fusarium irregulare]KAJ4023674.1 Multiple RNA-binding domain-containing protein 1 [Fusarium irregulare]
MASSRIFIKGLPPSISEADFRKHFSAQGREITDVKLIPQRRIGYVGYKTPEDASKAVKYFNRSYIRMSKIAVETARPISDPALNRHQSAAHSKPASQPSTTIKGKEQSAEKDSDSILRKRKRDEPQAAAADPKLREFLHVMKEGREGAMDDGVRGGVGDGVAAVAATAVPEEESDDEYEQIPARKEKQRRIEPPAKPIVSETLPSQLKEAKEVSDMQDKVPAGDEPVESTGATKPAVEQQKEVVAEDDDWLRSRTNRLLDLVDPDDLERTPVQGPSITETDHAQGGDAMEITPDNPPAADDMEMDEPAAEATGGEPAKDDSLEAIRRTSRLFVRNLPYSATEDDLREAFEQFGTVQEVHLPASKSGTSKGFALILFTEPSGAVEAFQAMDGATFQGRILHIIPASAKRDTALDEFTLSKLPLKKQNMIRKKQNASTSTFNWNALYMSQDAVNASVANRLGVSKSELLDPTSADAGVKQAIAETSVIQETKAYFTANGVDLEAFKSKKRGDTAILVKNFPYGTTIDELRKLFEESGPVLRVLMPPSGTIAIVQFSQPNHAKAAFGNLAYRRIGDSVLFLEKAPSDIFRGGDQLEQAVSLKDRPAQTVQNLSVNDLLSRGDKPEEELETTSLFVRNLNFSTSTSRLAETFKALDGFVSARVKTKMDPKKPGQTLSMGFGFVEFRTKSQAQAALKVMDGHVLDDHTLAVKASHKGHDAAEERRREDKARKAAGQRTKIIIKNLPFQVTKKDIRSLFSTYGQLRSVRLPKKADYTPRGFAFADFVTPREAENALNSLRDTHLLGRKLVLDFAEAEAVDAEEEIEKMQKKVGGQVNKMALQQLTGKGRTRVNIGNENEEMDV